MPGRWQTITFPHGIAPPRTSIADPRALSDGAKGAWVAVTVVSNGPLIQNVGGILLH